MVLTNQTQRFGPTGKRKVLISTILSILLFTIQITYASEPQTRVAIDPPSQVIPGTGVPIYTTIYHLGENQTNPLDSNADVPGIINSLETKGQVDRITRRSLAS